MDELRDGDEELTVSELPGVSLDKDLPLAEPLSSPPPGSVVFLSSFLTGLTWTQGHTGLTTC